MPLEQQPRLRDGKIPIFVFPTELAFYVDDRKSHKQVLTIYNPYDFPFRFKVLCTAPRKYNVVDSEGTVRPGCCVDILIRIKELSETGFGQRDKFRLNLYHHGQREVIGRKDVPALLAATAQGRGDQDNEDTSSQGSSPSSSNLVFAQANRGRAGPGATVVLLALMCIVALMLPTQGEKGSRLPDYLHLTVNQKLIAAYVLGLLTMVLLRT
ncbi:motile sperm domain-containing protein 1 [Strongylocentrotus purpuratus]|uniref:Motile sperm domain-containing protein 1 n=1 Tax=Strongylocentrotus purpuratus TaxID=7668 RepID=A0A7M7GMQ7_STRPU|nr:motile sperm domain-containing protein 1 [Strongylocentrotus purpuratus]XP_030838110.1 motile sperm domain-containing protein 1-like [Strongylocentrotus purpuratus]XP_030838136.1 motile sperm domain-containing protein 1 [Strongylocentrotus purpuratus]|eukprot:XP_003730214.1 PREDICTED: motile sperm domain-containing protein 1 [Strongylocentrotus purpuratus]